MTQSSRLTLGLAAGLAFGVLASATADPTLLAVARALRPVGAIFLNLLSMVVLPLVVAALFVGVAGLGSPRELGSVGAGALAFFWITTVVAIAIGFALAAALLPYATLSPAEQSALRTLAADSSATRQAPPLPGGIAFLIELVPRNPVQAAVQGSLLPLVVFTTIFAVGAATLPVEKRATLVGIGDAVTQVMIHIVQWVLALAPLGIFALVAGAVAQVGWSLVRGMAVMMVAVIAGTTLLTAIVYLPIVAVFAKVGPRRFLRAALPSMTMGFSTTSSLATLPTMLDAARTELSIPQPVAGFVLPLAATLNRGGSALYQAVAIVFMAGFYGTPIGLSQFLAAGAAIFLASLTVAAVPTGSVLSLAPAFTSMGLPLSGMSLLLGLDRIPDMFRTMTNVAGHLAAATTVARTSRQDA